MTKPDYSKLKKQELIAKCKQFKIDSTGKKNDLLVRLNDFVKDQAASSQESTDTTKTKFIFIELHNNFYTNILTFVM